MAIASCALLYAAPAAAAPCEPAAIDPDAARAPATWRAQLEVLRDRTKIAGPPWACQGGTIGLDLDAGAGAEIWVVDRDGQRRSQHVDGVDDIIPIGEGLLAKPLPDGTEPPLVDGLPPVAATARTEPPSPTSKPQGDGSTAPAAAGVAREPAVTLMATIGPRIAVPIDVVQGALTIRGLATPGGWAIGGWARVDGPSAAFDDPSVAISDAALGIAAGRRIAAGDLEMLVTIDPSVAVVFDRGGHADPELDARVGASVDLSLPISGPWRGVAGLEGELAPGRIDGERREQEPPMPAASFGIHVGAEIEFQ